MIDDIDQVLRNLHASDLTVHQAAQYLGWTDGRLAGRWWRMGLRRRRPHLTDEEVADLGRRIRDEDRRRPTKNSNRTKPLRRPPRRLPPSVLTRFVNPEDKRAGR